MENRSDLSGEVDLVIVRSLTRIRVLLDGGVTDTFELDLPAGSEDGTVEVVAVGGGGLRSTMSIEVDCHAPAELEVDVQLVCVDGELLLTIANTGDTTGVADVFIEQQAFVGSFLIAPGTQEIVRLDVAGLDGLPLRVVSDGDDVLRTTIDLDCPSAAIVASVALACPSGEVQLLIENTGDSPGTVLPVLDGERGEPIEIGAGESIVVIRRVDVGVETEVAVVSVDGDYYVRELIAPWVCESASGGPDQHTCASGEGGLARWQQIDAADIPLPPCPDLEVRLVFDCVDDAIDVEVINHTLDSRILTVVIGGETVVTDLAVAAEGSVAERYGDALGSRVVVLETGSTNELVNVTGSCRNNGHSDAETAAGLLVVLLSLVTAVVTKFDPWLRF